MSNLDQLLLRYKDGQRTQQLVEALTNGEAMPRLQIMGLKGSLAGFLMAGIYQKAGKHHLIVAGDKEEAGKEPVRQARQQPIMRPIRGQDDAVGRDGSTGRVDPVRVAWVECDDAGAFADLRARVPHRAGQPARVGQWIAVARTEIQDSPSERRGPGHSAKIHPVKNMFRVVAELVSGPVH